MSSNTTQTGGGGAIRASRTFSNPTFHDVLDADLDTIAAGQSSTRDNVIWAAVGGAIGAFPEAAQSLFDAFFRTPAIQLNLKGVLYIGVDFLLIGVIASALLLTSSARTSAKNKLTEIRARRTVTKVYSAGGARKP